MDRSNGYSIHTDLEKNWHSSSIFDTLIGNLLAI